MGKNKAMRELENAAEVVGKRPGWWVTALLLGVIGVGIWLMMSRQS